jgi:tetratricopeptide (TPR) repeat protein
MNRYLLLVVLWVLCCGTAASASTIVSRMSETTYRRLQVIEALMAENQLQQAAKKLDKILAKMPGRKADCAYIHFTCARLHLQQKNYPQAKSHFLSAYELDSFPENTQLQVLQNIAGLCMQEEDYKAAVTYYRAYLSSCSAPDKGAYLGLGTAYFQLKDYTAAIEVLTTAVTRFEPEPSPYLMLFSSHYELKQLPKATHILEKMVRLWPAKSQYWIQLAGIYIEQEAYDKSVEIMQAALTKGFLTKASELKQYVYALYEKQLPFKAATVLEQAITDHIVEENQKNYELLATLYQEAKERLKAVVALKKASNHTPNGKNDLCIAQLYFEMDDAHDQVIEYGRRAIEKGVQKMGRVHMLVAVSYSELGQLENARHHLNEAGGFQETLKASSQWLKYLAESQRY